MMKIECKEIENIADVTHSRNFIFDFGVVSFERPMQGCHGQGKISGK